MLQPEPFEDPNQALEGMGFIAALDALEVTPGERVTVTWELPADLVGTGSVRILVDELVVGQLPPTGGRYVIDVRLPEVLASGFAKLGQHSIAVEYSNPRTGSLRRELGVSVFEPDLGAWTWNAPGHEPKWKEDFIVGGWINGPRSLELKITGAELSEAEVDPTGRKVGSASVIKGGDYSGHLVPVYLEVRFSANVAGKTWRFYNRFQAHPVLEKRFEYEMRLRLGDQFGNGYDFPTQTQVVKVVVSERNRRLAKDHVSLQGLATGLAWVPGICKIAQDAADATGEQALDPLRPDFDPAVFHVDLAEPDWGLPAFQDPSNRLLAQALFAVHETIARFKELGVAEARWFGARLRDENLQANRQHQHYEDVAAVLRRLLRKLETFRDDLSRVRILTREELSDRFAKLQEVGLEQQLIDALAEAGLSKSDIETIRSDIYVYGPKLVPLQGLGSLLLPVIDDLIDIVEETLGGQPLVLQPS